MKGTSFIKNYRWPLLTAVGTGLALLLIAFMPMTNDNWEAMRGRIAELQAEARTRNTPRTVLGGKPIPGNAWDEYDIVMNDVMTLKEDPNGAISAVFAEGKETAAERQLVMKLIADHGAMLDHLRSGAQRQDGQYPYHWEQGRRMGVPSLLAARTIANFTGARAKALLDSGRARDAANLLLDLSVFARDVSANGPLLSSLIGDAVYTVAVDGLRNVILSGTLSSDELKVLADKLEAVDHDVPDIGVTLTNNMLFIGSAALELENENVTSQEWIGVMASGGWRYGLSSRRIAADLLKTTEALGRRSGKLGEMDFSEAMKEADAIVAEMSSSVNPLIRVAVPSSSRAVVQHREVVAKLRLLRAAAIWKATGKMPKLADPFDGELRMSESGDKIRMWSLGSDGVNQNGTGSWSDARGATAQDIPLELSKP